MNFTDHFLKSLDETQSAGINCINYIRALAILSRTEGGIVMSRLKDKLNVSSTAMTFMIDTFEQMKLADRVADPHDRRATRIFITAKGIEIIKKIVTP